MYSQYVKIGKCHTYGCTTAHTTMAECTQIITIRRWVVKIPHKYKPSDATEQSAEGHHWNAKFRFICPSVPCGHLPGDQIP